MKPLTSKKKPIRPSRHQRAARQNWSKIRSWVMWLSMPLLLVWFVVPAPGQMETSDALRSFEPETLLKEVEQGLTASDISDFVQAGPDEWTSPRGLSSTIKIMLMLTVLSLAPAILMMTTSFVRIVVVLGLLRQALGTQQLPPSQVITSLALFMTLAVMAPVFNEIKNEAVLPYIESEQEMSWEVAWERGTRPLKQFMSRQIEQADNSEDVWLFYRYLPQEQQDNMPETYDEVPFQVLLPAFMISELKVAFLIGFQIYLPFLVIDIVVSSVTISMGMLMLPPVMISLPFKLILFVLVDGWNLVVGMLLESFVPYTT